MNSAIDPLAQLKDIYIPPDPGIWPPAIGWWIVFVLFLAAAAWAVRKLLRIVEKNKPHKFFIRQLSMVDTRRQTDNQIRQLQEMAKLLRQFAMHKFGREKVSRLHGQDWLDFLDAAGEKSRFSSGIGKVFASDVYSRGTSADSDEIKQHLIRWSKTVK